MKNILLILPLFALLSFASCGSSENENGADGDSATTTTGTADMDYDAMAVELCECMTPMVDFQNKLMAMLAEGKEDEIMAMQNKAMEMQKDGEACVQALEAKYGVVEGEEAENKAMKALEKACPEFVAMMEASAPPPGMGDIPIEELEKAVEDMQEAENK